MTTKKSKKKKTPIKKRRFNKRIVFGIGTIIPVILVWMIGLSFKAPAVSVVMSTYNRAGMLPRAMESILNQTFTDFELIVINDGSSDRTADILKSYVRRDKRVKVITNDPNAGLIASLNKGIDKARGKYIARMDDDDISLPNRLERQYSFMENHPEVALVGSWVSPLNSNKPYSFQRETDPDIIKLQLYLGIAPVSHPSVMIRRSFLNQHQIRYRFGYEAAEDRPFYGEILSTGGVIGNIPEVLLRYRLHNSNNRDYYSKQNKNKRRFHIEFMNDFFPISYNDSFRKCDLLPRMIEANKEKQILPQEKIERFYREACQKEMTENKTETSAGTGKND